jgi:hypothetical protein
MTRLTICLLAGLSLPAAVFPLPAADLKDIQNEPNLERRAHLALDYADSAFSLAKEAYAAGNVAKTSEELLQMQSGVEAAQSALEATGKDARRHAKPFKLAETQTRDLLRRLEGLANSMAFDDRKIIEGPKAKVQEVHDQWLDEIILGKH